MSKAKFKSTDTSLSCHFCLEGQFLGFAPERKSQFRYLQVMTQDGTLPIKLSKALQLMLFRYLLAGDWVRVVGRKKWDAEQEVTKFKADEVVRIAPPTTSDGISPAAVLGVEAASRKMDDQVQSASKSGKPSKAPKAKASKILICQKSPCRKRGGGVIAEMVERSLCQQGLEGQVKVKYTGCMDRCKAGPNVVFMPDKAKYSRVKPGMIPELVSQHCAVTGNQSPAK
ncbi:MAG: (2Fe-2S) ferredoxin domain-containing protein [Cyanothece sp. SIO2G6]|nr:(2Fe-2S) ferredoxin domain-containing protein [Cyanothece sp. SIO2G6]